LQNRSDKTSSPLARVTDYALLLVLSLIWGLAFVAIRELDTQLGFGNLTLLRWLVAAAGYLGLLLFAGKAKAKLDKADLPRLLLIGFLNVAVYHLALNYGEVTVTAGLAGLLITLGPVFSVLLAAAFLREKVHTRFVFALVLAVGGAAVLFAGDLPAGLAPWGPLAVVLAALSYAMFGLLSRPLVKKYGALHVAIWAGVVGTVMILPLVSASFFSDVSRLPLTGWEALLYLSLLSTVAGYSMFYTLVGRVGVSRLMIQLYLAPVVSVIGGVLLLGESVSTYTLLGGALMLLAVWLATTRR
jgi:drug/metabolite transporter (DMT)-like permease